MANRNERARPQAKEPEQRVSHPTPIPSFNMEQFARQSDKDMRIAEEEPTRPRGMESDVHDVALAAPALEIDEAVTDEETEEVCWARIGEKTQVPVLSRPIDELLWEERAPGEAMVLSSVDGRSNVRTIVETCGLPPLVALQLLCELLDSGVLRLAG
jgi:hypothetical protein